MQEGEIPCEIINEDYLYIYELSQSELTVGHSIELRIEGFRNALFLEPEDQFILQTLDAAGGLIEQSSLFAITPTQPASIIDASLRLASNSETSSKKVSELSDLVLDFTMPVPLEAGCIIKVRLPEDFQSLREELGQV